MYLLDTNVVSELRKIRSGKADGHVANWADSVDTVDLYLSVITLQELEIGVLLAEHRDPARGAGRPGMHHRSEQFREPGRPGRLQGVRDAAE